MALVRKRDRKALAAVDLGRLFAGERDEPLEAAAGAAHACEAVRNELIE